jgi:hypothetical protein
MRVLIPLPLTVANWIKPPGREWMYRNGLTVLRRFPNARAGSESAECVCGPPSIWHARCLVTPEAPTGRRNARAHDVSQTKSVGDEPCRACVEARP